MTEPKVEVEKVCPMCAKPIFEDRVEAGDRALETARQISKQINCDFAISQSAQNYEVSWIAVLIQSAMNAQDKARLGTDWQELAEKNQETADKALALVDAMNAQVRELREALRRSMRYIRCGHLPPDAKCTRCALYAKAERLLAERGEAQ